MCHYEEITMVMIFGNIDAVFRQELCSCPLHVAQVVSIIDDAPCIGIFIINFHFNTVVHNYPFRDDGEKPCGIISGTGPDMKSNLLDSSIMKHPQQFQELLCGPR